LKLKGSVDKHWNVPEEDLRSILEWTPPSLWRALDGKNLFITGGTGFIGKWLLETLAYAIKVFQLKTQVVVLTRSSASFLQQNPVFCDRKNFQLLEADLLAGHVPALTLPYPIHLVIHGAAETNLHQPGVNPAAIFDALALGTRHILDFCTAQKIEKFLLLSSGAIYGEKFIEEAPQTLSEDSPLLNRMGLPTTPSTAYASGKFFAENMTTHYSTQFGLNTVIARCFAFAGPHLPLDSHYALGNFINDTLHQRSIVIKGSGQSLRSYLYTADLAAALFKILVHGLSGKIYNVGSDQAISIRDLAELVSERAQFVGITSFKNAHAVTVLNQRPSPSHRDSAYLPNIDLLKSELNFKIHTPLESAIQKSLLWANNKNGRHRNAVDKTSLSKVL
jgi:nucleoside-diphosphate-sugar epimerase